MFALTLHDGTISLRACRSSAADIAPYMRVHRRKNNSIAARWFCLRTPGTEETKIEGRSFSRATKDRSTFSQANQRRNNYFSSNSQIQISGPGSLRCRHCRFFVMQETKGLGLYNVVIILAGTAGLVTAAGTAGLGGRVALVERNKMGGDCLNYGCVPSKALIASARVIDSIRHASRWGLDEQEPRFEFETVFESMRSRRAQIAPHDSAERFESLGVDVFRGEAHFVSPHEIVVDGRTLHGKNFVIAAGSRAGIPPIEGIRDVPFFTNETIFDGLRHKPEEHDCSWRRTDWLRTQPGNEPSRRQDHDCRSARTDFTQRRPRRSRLDGNAAGGRGHPGASLVPSPSRVYA